MDDLETPALRIFGEDDERRSNGRSIDARNDDAHPNDDVGDR
jgi:hypothetical protein